MSKSSSNGSSTQAVSQQQQQQPKIYGKLSKKVDEVREVVQNRTDVDIAKVLEYFDLNVGKTIDAFVTDNGKEALAKWAEKKRRSDDSQYNQSNNNLNNGQLDQESNGDTSRNGGSNNRPKNHNKQNGGKKNHLANSSNSSLGSSQGKPPSSSGAKPFNINELVASVIKKYTSDTPPVPNSVSTNNNIINSSELEKRLTETLKLDGASSESANTISNSSSSSTIIPTSSSSLSASQLIDSIPPTYGGVKITVLGIQTANSMNAISSTPKPASHANTVNDSASFVSSTTSSPSSMSIVSTSSAFSNPAAGVQINGGSGARPYLLELKQNGAQPVNLFNTAGTTARLPSVNKSYVNQRVGKDAQLERLQRDLNRQQSQLTKICGQYEEQLTRDRALLTTTFAEIRRLLDAREHELDRQLVANAQQGAKILQNRQAKAAWLKVLSDNARHLDDQKIGELKSDIKHFVSERQLDEEFSGVRFISFDNASNSEKIASIGVVNQVLDKYSKDERTRAIDSSSSSTPVHVSTSLVPSSASSLSSSTSHSPSSSQQKPTTNGVNGAGQTVDKNNNNHNKQNGSTNGNEALNGGTNGGFENDFIEVKKPQRNRNKKPSSDQANNSLHSSQAPQQQQHSKTNGNMKTALNNTAVNGTVASNNNSNNNSNRAMLNGRQVYAK